MHTLPVSSFALFSFFRKVVVKLDTPTTLSYAIHQSSPLFRTLMASSNIPNAWDEEDWERPADVRPSSSPPSPPPSSPPPLPLLPPLPSPTTDHLTSSTSQKQNTFAPVIASRRPNPAAPSFNPPTAPRLLRASAPEFDHTAPLLYTPSSGGVPKTLYKPELKILKRSSPEIPGAPAAAAAGSVGGVEETEKERRERERKEKERRYKEARERIMGDNAAAAGGAGKGDIAAPPDGAAEPGGNGKGKKAAKNSGKRSPESNNTPQRTPKSSNRTSPRNSSPAARSPSTSRAPSRKPSPPRNSGAITSFSLNGGAFAAAPASQSNSRYYAQKEVDGKLLESQLHTGSEEGAGNEAHLTTETNAEGLDWDSFSRDTTWPRQQQQHQQPPWSGPQPQAWPAQGGYYQAGVDYGYSTAGAAISGGPAGYSGGYDYQTAALATGQYDCIPQLPPRQQNPAIYGAAATAEFPPSRYTVGYGHPERQTYAEKQSQAPKQPGAAGQAVRAPRGPDADGGRGFKGRGGGGSVVERMGALGMGSVSDAENWGGA